MPKQYEVLERSFINGRLYEAGDSVELEIDSPGSNLKELKEAPKPKGAKASNANKADTSAKDADDNLPDA